MSRYQRWDRTTKSALSYADGSEELYDHQNDPHEWTNLANKGPNLSHAQVIDRLKKHLPKTNASQRGS